MRVMASLAEKILNAGRTNPVEQLGNLPLWQRILNSVPETGTPKVPTPLAFPTPASAVPLWQKIIGGQQGETFLQTYNRVGAENTAATKAVFDPNAPAELREKGRQRFADMTFGFTGTLQNVAKKGVVKGVQALKGSADDTLKPLAQEARKYKSAEEFVKAQTKTEYAMSHRPSETGAIASDISKKGEVIPKDVYDHPEWYANMKDQSYQESFKVLRLIKGDPEAGVTIYRTSPKGELNRGDWVTLSRTYAKEEALKENYPVHSFRVQAKDIQFAGDDLNEFGYYPKKLTGKESQLTDIWNKAHNLLK